MLEGNITAYEYLRQYPEPIPEWLANFTIGEPFNIEPFFASRVVYYPGSGLDGHPVQLFGSTQSAHCFIYVDYLVPQDEIEKELQDRGFLGYDVLAEVPVPLNLLWPPDITLINEDFTYLGPLNRDTRGFIPFGLLVILQRSKGRDNNHGPNRIAILFLGADGIAAYGGLFCIPYHRRRQPPFAVVVQDHGFGGGYCSFGNDGLLHKIVQENYVYPEYLLVAENSTAWAEFDLVPYVDCDRGIGAFHFRCLYRRKDVHKNIIKVNKIEQIQYDNWVGETNSIIQEILNGGNAISANEKYFINKYASSNILDIGCCNGHRTFPEWMRKGLNFYGVEKFQNLIDSSKYKEKITRADISDVNFSEVVRDIFNDEFSIAFLFGGVINGLIDIELRIRAWKNFEFILGKCQYILFDTLTHFEWFETADVGRVVKISHSAPVQYFYSNKELENLNNIHNFKVSEEKSEFIGKLKRTYYLIEFR